MTLDRVKEIISQNTRIDINEIYDDTDLYNDLAIDSVEIFKIITALEDELDASLSMAKAMHVKTVSELYDFVNVRM